MKKVLSAVAGAVAIGAIFIGCELNPASNDDKVSIELSNIPSIAAGDVQSITAKIDGNVAISSVSVKISDSYGDDVSSSDFTISKENFDFGAGEKKIKIGDNQDMYIRITPKATACNGTYTFTISATAGAGSSSKSTTFDVTGGMNCDEPDEDPLTEREVVVGNQSASKGSALDVDEMKVYSSSEANGSASVQAKVDAWFGIVGGKATVMAPASANGFAPITKDWTNKNATKFLKVTVDFDDVTYQSEIDELWTGSGESLVNISKGDVFVVKTNAGDYRLLKIEAASNDPSGEVTVVGKIK